MSVCVLDAGEWEARQQAQDAQRQAAARGAAVPAAGPAAAEPAAAAAAAATAAPTGTAPPAAGDLGALAAQQGLDVQQLLASKDLSAAEVELAAANLALLMPVDGKAAAGAAGVGQPAGPRHVWYGDPLLSTSDTRHSVRVR